MPVDPVTLGAYVIAVSALVVTPGPDTILILRYTLGSGQRVGLATVAGVQMGLAVHTLLAVAGISLIIASSPLLFKSVAVLGALYLAWLGMQGLRDGGALSLGGEGGRVGAAQAVRDAALCNLLNPKVILIFLALLPNFIDPGRGNVSGQLLTLGGALILINTLWQAPLAWLAQAVRQWLIRPEISRILSRLTGCILLFFAALMIYDNLLT